MTGSAALRNCDATEDRQTAILGGGCFWCLEPVFAELKGVLSARCGYAGGRLPNPTYEAVCQGTTGHAEVVELQFDPSVIAFETLLEVFFALHDPTSLNRQGNDVGTQYRSVAFCLNETQERVVREALARLNASGMYPVPAVTEVAGPVTFYPAEDYHQQYIAQHGHEPYCSFVVAPKIAKARKRFAALLKSG